MYVILALFYLVNAVSVAALVCFVCIYLNSKRDYLDALTLEVDQRVLND